MILIIIYLNIQCIYQLVLVNYIHLLNFKKISPQSKITIPYLIVKLKFCDHHKIMKVTKLTPNPVSMALQLLCANQ